MREASFIVICVDCGAGRKEIEILLGDMLAGTVRDGRKGVALRCLRCGARELIFEEKLAFLGQVKEKE